MLRKNFPFKQISPLDMPRPMLPIIIKNRKTGDSIFAWGLIDTGADSCAIPAKYAGILGHRLKAGAKINIGTGNGSTCAYAHTTEIDISFLLSTIPGSHSPCLKKTFAQTTPAFDDNVDLGNSFKQKSLSLSKSSRFKIGTVHIWEK
ncbi:MAG: hypothetical protein WAX69_26155 [Victivallales bacterium]